MNLEEMLAREREADAPNPLVDRTAAIVTRVRRRRRARAAAAAAAGLAALAVVSVIAGQLLPDEIQVSASQPAQEDPVPLTELPDGPLDPGRYQVSIDGGAPSAPLLPVLSVPEGYERIEDGTGVRTDDFDRYVSVWDIASVYAHPCATSAEPVGPTVADLAQALADQQLRTGTDPVPVTVGGYDGLYVELRVPDHVDADACAGDVFSLWPGRAESWRDILGQVDMVWILDVDGERITIDAAHLPDATPEEVAELQQMVTSATFAPPDGP